MEQDDAMARKRRRAMQVQSGRTAENLAVLAYNAELEARLLTAPTFVQNKAKLQNPDGSFKPMPGFDPP